jgi:hypothetical protein
MAGFISSRGATVGRPGEIHTSALNVVGAEAVSTEGYTYKYLKGVASTVAGDFVTYDGAGQTARTGASSTGGVAIATAAVVANQYGWYLVEGKYATANVATHSSGAGKALFVNATAGRATTTPLSEGCIQGAFSDGNSASNVGPVLLVKKPSAAGDIST